MRRSFLASALRAGYFGTPVLLALLVYWPGLTSWFQKDDFVWLGLRSRVHSGSDLCWALFAPMAQGTIRILSERAFFMSFSAIFGLHPIAFHCFAFLVFAVTSLLVASCCAMLTGSRAAGFWAAIFWTAGSGVAIALSWIAVCHELLCAFFLLSSLWFLLRYAETGQSHFYVAQCASFVLGFGVEELNVVYPAIAAVYALCSARHIFRKTIPLFAVSVAYMAVHLAASPLPASGPYKMHWGPSMVSTLWAYWKLAMGPSQLIVFNIHPSPLRASLTALLTFGLVGFLGWKLRQRAWIAAFFPAWFLIALAPLLPLQDHIDYSYLTVPSVGLAMWGGYAVISGWSAGLGGRAASVLLSTIYLCVNLPVGHAISVSFDNRSQKIRTFVLGVVDASRKEPGKLVLLRGVEPDLFWSAVFDRPFQLFGIQDVYVAAEDKPAIPPDPQLEDPREFFADPVVEANALRSGRALVLDVSGGSVRDITAEYRLPPEIEGADRLAARVDVGNDLLAGQLGPTWYANEGGFRWMPRRASVTLRGPRAATERLYVTGSCPAAVLATGPLGVSVSIDGQKLATVFIYKPEEQFSFVFQIPQRLISRPSVEVTVELDRTFLAPPDPRELGLPFGVFEIR